MTDVTIEEIEAIVATFAPLDEDAAGQAMARQLDLGATMGGDAALASWIAGCQRRYPVRLGRPRLAVFAAAHGADPAATAGVERAIESTGRGEGSLYAWSEEIDADLRIYEMALDEPSDPAGGSSALPPSRLAAAIAYGMMAVDDATDVLGIAALNPAADLPAAALGRALFGGDAEEWGVDEGAETDATPFQCLADCGGEDIAAAAGAIIAARLAGAPVLLEGLAVWAAAGVVAAIRDDGIDHCALLTPPEISRATAFAAFDRHLPAARLEAAAGVMPGEGAARAIAELRVATTAHADDRT